MSLYKGKNLTIEIFGASHAEEIGVKIWGLPCGEPADPDLIREFLDKRKPKTELNTARREADEPVISSGVSGCVTDGSVFCAVLKNTDVVKSDYVNSIPRPGHADYSAWTKYGKDFDMSGGGPFSGRMTAPLCIAGAIFKQYLSKRGIEISHHIVSIGGKNSDFENTVKAAKEDGDSTGGLIECTVSGVPAGLGGELFDGLDGLISSLCFAIPAVKGVEFGAGFSAANMRGSENNDDFCIRDGSIVTATNNHGGILGGISSGMPIVFRAAIKPTPTISKQQKTVNVETMTETVYSFGGRHDPCIALRAGVCFESVAAIAVADHVISLEKSGDLGTLRSRIDQIDREITELFTRRLELCKEIGEYKKAHALPVCDTAREAEKLNAVRTDAGEEFADEAEKLYRDIMRISREFQDKI